ncbi:MAG: alpha/beta fold hydrolase [Promethearchaeota archaeon]|nr:MAG: alpha/beta fold hydrolase [Candidatus Lokiarchaeota archaeon]
MSEKSNLNSNSPVVSVPPDYYPQGCGFWFELREGLDAGKRMFYRDSIHGSGEPNSTIVLVHGNPESSYTYRDVIKHLIANIAKPIRIVAMDHVGFGLSDQASFEMVCMDHADNLLQLIKFLDLRNVTLIVHDWGGPIGIGAFLKVPKRVSNLVILNTTVFPMPKTGLRYDKNFPVKGFPWSKFPKIIPNEHWGAFASFAIFFNPEDPQELVKNMPNMLAQLRKEGTLVENETIAQKFFREQFMSESNVMSSKRLVLQTPEWGYGNIYKEPILGERDTTPFYRYIQDNITDLWGPKGQNIGTYAVLGRWDPSAKDEVIAQWIENLPQLENRVKIFEDAGHFIEECEPEAVSDAIMDIAGLK